jgi:hypothetical protein
MGELFNICDRTIKLFRILCGILSDLFLEMCKKCAIVLVAQSSNFGPFCLPAWKLATMASFNEDMANCRIARGEKRFELLV